MSSNLHESDLNSFGPLYCVSDWAPLFFSLFCQTGKRRGGGGGGGGRAGRGETKYLQGLEKDEDHINLIHRETRKEMRGGVVELLRD